MTKASGVLFSTAFIVFCLVNIITLKDGHNWGDDFAQYILHAINIVEHRPYSENIALDLWTVVPPGYPFLLSSVIYWFGINFKILKALNILFWGLAGLAAYFLTARRLKSPWPMILSVWFLTAPFFFLFKQSVLSDIPFLCFVSLSIWAFTKYDESIGKDPGTEQIFHGLAIFLMSYALLMRWAGIGLFLAAFLYLCIVKRAWTRCLGFALGAVVALAIQVGFGSSMTGHFGHSQFSLQTWLYAAWMNTAYLPKVLSDFIVSEPSLSKITAVPVFLIFKVVGPVLVLAFTIFFLYRLSIRKISFLGCFTFLYFLGMILWPVQQGTVRYILPIIIPLTIYGLEGAQTLFRKPITEKILAALFVFFIIQNVYVMGVNFKFDDDNIYQKDSLEMAGWVADNISSRQHYMFNKPRALRLLAQRTGAAFWVYPEDQPQWYRRIRLLNIEYLIADKQIDQVAQYNEVRLPVDGYELSFNRVWENSRYKIFRVLQ